MLSNENKHFACKLQSVVRILSDMDPWILKAIAVFAAVLIVDTILFLTARRRNRRMCVIRVERIVTRGWREGDDK